MASCGFGSFVTTLLILVASLAATIVAILTDYWYSVETEGVVTEVYKRENTYTFGFWRKCYDDRPLSLSPSRQLSDTGRVCKAIYKDLIPSSESNMTNDEKLVMHLSRSYIGLALASAAAQLATIITLLCGAWPGDCNQMRKVSLYICALIVLVMAILSSIASGVCFIAARDVETDELHLYRGLDTTYGWSFMLHWIGAGLTVVDGIMLLAMMRWTHEDVGDLHRNYYNI
ncbi:claudin domain-containing protein 1 [Plakobranchus ocellatus]|uniref:Claudin domain-containing protein 1 n=1 Tax=Plakobranchus ocellatus TaxID=259542 RepID=A0AAV3Y7C9_9GAST|nr:claudin domain-containing protein 1 [Plakobranchus ocellatus]